MIPLGWRWTCGQRDIADTLNHRIRWVCQKGATCPIIAPCRTNHRRRPKPRFRSAFSISVCAPTGAGADHCGDPVSCRRTEFNSYWKYGPTPDNAAPHWYVFDYDGETGARFLETGEIVLRFKDGERGDDDLRSATARLRTRAGRR